MFEQIYDKDNLFEGYLQIKPASSWKEETQRFEYNLVSNINDLSNDIKHEKYIPGEPRGFIYSERGKTRYIESRNVPDRIVQRVVHNKIIEPAIRNKIIYDNASSVPLRGTDFFRRRLVIHLKEFAKEYGIKGYVLILDFKKFFDNIWHLKLIDEYSKIIHEEAAMRFISLLILSNAVDVSYMTEQEYLNCMYIPFNNLDYRLKVINGEIIRTGKKFMPKYMGIGSQMAQDAGVYYPHRIDNYCKIVKGIRGYGRYMDDIYVIHHSKDFLWRLLEDIIQICSEYGIFINENKTQIINLKHEFTILKNRYKLYENGSVKVMPNNDSFIRERKKLNKQYDLLESGKIPFNDIYESYASWRGGIIQRNNGNEEAVKYLDEHYSNLFIKPFAGGYEYYG